MRDARMLVAQDVLLELLGKILELVHTLLGGWLFEKVRETGDVVTKSKCGIHEIC
jgi:hypothetical protein